MTEHNKYYWDTTRNKSTTQETDNRVPTYYIGKTPRNGYYQARYVVEDFDCTYNVGTAYVQNSSTKMED